MYTGSMKIVLYFYILQFLFYKGENAGQATENVNSVSGSDTVRGTHAQFCFRGFRSGNFGVNIVLLLLLTEMLLISYPKYPFV